LAHNILVKFLTFLVRLFDKLGNCCANPSISHPEREQGGIKMKFAHWLKCGAALAVVGASPVMAQDAPASEAPAAAVADIVVTAQRREQRLQDVPLAVSAFSMESLEDGKVESLLNLDGKVPNVVLAPVG